jgi:zinc protease
LQKLNLQLQIIKIRYMNYMKHNLKLVVTILIFSFATTLIAQVNTSEFFVNGLKVIHKTSIKETVSIRLFVKGGSTNYPMEKQGIENLAFKLAMEGGTTTKNKQAFAAASEKVGATYAGTSGADFGTLSMTCLKMYWNESWDLFADAITNPAMGNNEFELVKSQLINEAQQAVGDPDSHLGRMAMKNAFGGTSYEKNPAGTPESLQGIKLEETAAYYKNLIGKKNSFLVVVGNITQEDLTKKITSAFAKMPDGKPAAIEVHKGVGEGKVSIEDRDIETNYIIGVMDAPKKGTDEAVANSIAMSIMGDRFFTELRTKRSLSYAPAAFSAGDISHPNNGVYISTTNPKESLKVMTEELNKVKKEGFTQKELDGTKQGFLTTYYMGQETNERQSLSLGRNEIMSSWKDTDLFTQRVNSATLTDINNVMKKYIESVKWNYLGKESMVKPEDFLQPAKNSALKR